MLDIGLYENSRPRNFNQIEPDDIDENARRDKLRSSPKVSLEKLKEDAAVEDNTGLLLSDSRNFEQTH